MRPCYDNEDNGRQFHNSNGNRSCAQPPSGFADPSKLRRGKPGSFVDRDPPREPRRSAPQGDYGYSNMREAPAPGAFYNRHHGHAGAPLAHFRRPAPYTRHDESQAFGADSAPRPDGPGRLDRLDAFMKGRFEINDSFLSNKDFRAAVDKHVEEQARRQQFAHLIAYTNRVEGCSEELELAYTATDHAAWARLHDAPLTVTWWSEDGSFQKQDELRFMAFQACMMCQVEQTAGSGGPMKKGWCLLVDPVTKRNRLNVDLFWSTVILWLTTRSAGTYWWDRQFEMMVRNVEASGQKTQIHRWRRQHSMGMMPRSEDGQAEMEMA